MKSCGACTSRMACRTYGCQRAARERIGLRADEVLFSDWCQDMAIGCRCVPHEAHGVPCISVARGHDGLVSYDRCLGCGARWASRDYRWETSVALRPFDAEEVAA